MSRFLVFLWLLFIPTQLGWHFWPEWSHVMGLRVDYLSPTLYFLDILWVGMMLKLQTSNFKLQTKKSKNLLNYLIVFIFILINIFVAQNHWEAGYRWIRIFQWIITFKFILNNKKLFKEMLMMVLPFWIVGESLLGLAQVINGGSINGIFYWLGERRFSYISIGVAQISYLGEGLIRAYGTFSHPNSLAGFMLISLIVYMRYQNIKHQTSNIKLKRIQYWMVVFCGILGIILAGSRVVGMLLVILFLYAIRGGHIGPPLHKIMGTILIFGGVIILIFSLISNNYRISDFVGGWDSEGMSKRGGLMVASIKMIGDNPLFGVGAGNFLVRLPEYQRNSGVFWLQPVHNIIILIITEFGIVGILILIKLQTLNFKLQIKNKKNLITLGIILVTGMVDHYWLTLPQNIWLLCVVLGMV